MEFDKFGEIRLLVDGKESSKLLPSSSSSSLFLCRICHEEEQGSAGMENPCACSGTLKFAHRECIQKWCDMKGSTVCEICLKKFEPGYTVTAAAPEKPRMIDVVITIRGSLEAAGLNNEPQSPAMVLISSEQRDLEHTVYSPVLNQGRSCYHSVALMFTTMILLRHLLLTLFVDSEHYAATLSIVYLRSVSILLPSYLIVRLISRIRKSKRHQRLYERHESADDIEQQQQQQEM